MCDGASWEEVVAEESLEIAVNGYVLCGVAGDDHAPWVYTIGLSDAAGHPELIVAGVDPSTSATMLNACAEAILEGERFAVGERISVGDTLARVGAIDDAQYGNDTFAHWHALRAAGVIEGSELSAVQLVLEGAFCAEHESAQPILANASARVGLARTRPNRAARRQRNKKPRGRRRQS
jgi:hypothetical protein